MAPTAYLCVHNSFQKHHSQLYIPSYAVTASFEFHIFNDFYILRMLFFIEQPPLDSGISQLHTPTYCTFTLAVQLRYVFLSALLHITRGCRLQLQLARVRLGEGLYLGLL